MKKITILTGELVKVGNSEYTHYPLSLKDKRKLNKVNFSQGRGKTLDFIWYDEVDYISTIKDNENKGETNE